MSEQRFSPAHAFPLERVPSWDLETDVAVVGFGASGASTAIEAAGEGAQVTLFELGSGSGGTCSAAPARLPTARRIGWHPERRSSTDERRPATRDRLP